jgi:hypothetical protein
VINNREHYHPFKYRDIKNTYTNDEYLPHSCVTQAHNEEVQNRMRSKKENIMERWDLVKRTGLKVGKNERIALRDGEVVIERQVSERDVTGECTVELRRSKSSSGYYVSIIHEGRSIIALGVDENSKFLIRNNGYTVESSPDGHVSFRIKSTRT